MSLDVVYGNILEISIEDVLTFSLFKGILCNICLISVFVIFLFCDCRDIFS